MGSNPNLAGDATYERMNLLVPHTTANRYRSCFSILMQISSACQRNPAYTRSVAEYLPIMPE